jgi:hypothetical protein
MEIAPLGELASGARLRGKGNSSLGGAGERSETEGVEPPPPLRGPPPQWGGIFSLNLNYIKNNFNIS